MSRQWVGHGYKIGARLCKAGGQSAGKGPAGSECMCVGCAGGGQRGGKADENLCLLGHNIIRGMGAQEPVLDWRSSHQGHRCSGSHVCLGPRASGRWVCLLGKHGTMGSDCSGLLGMK
eukprot:1161553-Pelagomonas_calceolata.AAC.3